MQLVGDGEALKVDESSLTGESLAVSRKSGDQVWPLQQNVKHAHFVTPALFRAVS